MIVGVAFQRGAVIFDDTFESIQWIVAVGFRGRVGSRGVAQRHDVAHRIPREVQVQRGAGQVGQPVVGVVRARDGLAIAQRVAVDRSERQPSDRADYRRRRCAGAAGCRSDADDMAVAVVPVADCRVIRRALAVQAIG